MVGYNNKFRKRKLAALISSITLASISAQAVYAQGEVEEVIVKGIRGSLTNSLNVKREATGVVDAITAEDIGKFPDTNLAESLQRISGVSINRSNGEGQQVTVRGFGADFNIVTLNGRHMPTASTDFSAAPANSRAFDFSNIAAEGVTGVQVYKTGRASVATGGIGSAINISTYKPFDKPGFQATVGGKLVHDTTNEAGDDVTPEISALLSTTFGDDDMFGVSFVGSFQERHSGSNAVNVNDWSTQAFDPNSAFFDDVNITNAPDEGQLWSQPRNLIWQVDETERERTNAQLTFQLRPVDSVTATLDYTYSELEVSQSRAEQSIWFVPGGDNPDLIDGLSAVTFDNGSVATPIIYSEVFTPIADDPATPIIENPAEGEFNGNERVAGQDLTFAAITQGLVNENDSFGLNVEWQVDETLSLYVDLHDSEAKSGPLSGRYGNASRFSVAAFAISEQTALFNREVPIMQIELDDAGIVGGGDGVNGVEDLSSTRGFAQFSDNKTEIKQIQLGGKLEFDESTIDFGVEARFMENNSRASEVQPIFGDWGGTDPGLIPDEFFSPTNFASDFGGGFDQGFTYDFFEAAAWAEGQFAAGTPNFADFVGPGGTWSTDRIFDTNRTIEEDTASAFVQSTMTTSIAGKEVGIVAGLRYETTDVTSSSDVRLPTVVRWEADDDFQIPREGDVISFRREGSYSELLPSIDLDMDINDDLKARVSYSKTMARPLYNDLRSDFGDFSFNAGRDPTASAGNPGLSPITSDNLDISFEWYYGESSLASIGYFRKDVDNFVGTSIVEQDLFGLTNPITGDRGAAAAADLEGEGADPQTVYDSNANGLFNQVLTNAGLDPEDQSTFIDGDAALGDPLVEWLVSTPINNESSTVSGFEFSVQHFFGDSGFGTIANYTVVNGDIDFDTSAASGADQFVLTGLSDTFNLIGIYEKYGFQARISLNWRDDFFANTEGNGEPRFTEDFTQVDINVSYDINDNFNVFLEGININEEDFRQHGRTEAQLLQFNELGARYQLGARYKF